MGRRALAWVVGFGVCWAASACAAEVAFVCTSDQQCGDDGHCEATGFCSFPDATCGSGRRYGQLSAGHSGQCVVPEGDTDLAGTDPSTSTVVPTTDGSDSSGPLVSASDSTTQVATVSSTSTSDATGESSSSGTPVTRVVDGLLALWAFQEGAGAVVEDVSGVEPPIDLSVMGAGYRWGADGLTKFNDTGILLAEGSATKVLTACQASDAITLEAWVTPAELVPEPSPARVLTYSVHTSLRNFTLGQTNGSGVTAEPAWVVRLRTDMGGDLNGLPPLVFATDIPFVPTHLVFVHDADGSEAIYVDAVEQATGSRMGTFDTWDPDTAMLHIALGNELTLDRSWNGTFHLAAIYDRALTVDEVQQNFDAGY